MQVEHKDKVVVLTVDYDELELVKDGLSELTNRADYAEAADYLQQMVKTIKESY